MKQLFKHSFTYAVFIFAVVTGFVGYFVLDTYFQITNVNLTYSNKAISLLGLNVFDGENLLLLDTNLVTSQLKQRNPRIKTLKINKHYPSTVDLSVVIQNPVVQLQGDSGWFLLSENGTILEKQEASSAAYPAFYYYQKLHFADNSLADVIDFKDILFAIEVQQKLASIGLPISKVDIKDYTEINFYHQNQVYRFSLEKTLKQQWYEIERIVKELKLQGKEYLEIDVRFDKPVYK